MPPQYVPAQYSAPQHPVAHYPAGQYQAAQYQAAPSPGMGAPSAPAQYPAAPAQYPAAAPQYPAAAYGSPSYPGVMPASAVPASSAPASSMPYAAGPVGFTPAPLLPGPRQKRRWMPYALFAVILVLVAAVVVQAIQLSHLSGRLSTDNRASNARISRLEAGSTKVQSKLAGQMNTETVAATADASVFEVEAGDAIGSSWAVAHPSSGGTDLITNFHVIAGVYATGSRSVNLLHKTEEFKATIKRVNKNDDLALLHMSANYPVLAVQYSALIGEPVVAVGEPFGLRDTVTAGVVSALDRTIPGGTNNEKFIQFDASINPGNSGGPVVNAKVQVLGIASDGIPSGQGLGFAIPVATACSDLQTC
jgi:putative serine protease PepD